MSEFCLPAYGGRAARSPMLYEVKHSGLYFWHARRFCGVPSGQHALTKLQNIKALIYYCHPSEVRVPMLSDFIHLRFTSYDKAMRDIWETHSLCTFYFNVVNKLLRKDEIPLFEFVRLAGYSHPAGRDDTYGAISHFLSVSNPNKTLIEAVSRFEDLLTLIAYNIYVDFPKKLFSEDTSEAKKSEKNYLKVIIESSSKDEMVSKIADNKVKSLFYQQTDKLLIKKNSPLYTSASYPQNILNQYKEIISRRNIIIHNQGKVDDKYLQNVYNATYKKGNKVISDDVYLRESISFLLYLSAYITANIIKHNYNIPIQGILKRRLDAFSRKYMP